MLGDPMEDLARLRDDGEALLRRARSAARVSGEPGVDGTRSVTVTLDEHGRVATVTVARDWRSYLAVGRLGDAVAEAVQDAAVRRLAAWGETFAEPVTAEPRSPADGLREQVDAISAARIPAAEREAALLALLEVVEAVDRGLDEVAGRIQQAQRETHTGHSPHREVSVDLTGGGDVAAVRFDWRWVRDAHEANLGRQVTSAFQAAYALVAAHGVDQAIADSPLGRAQWTMQDPFGFARRHGGAGR
jgi:DNA-binding protein YbaB